MPLSLSALFQNFVTNIILWLLRFFNKKNLKYYIFIQSQQPYVHKK